MENYIIRIYRKDKPQEFMGIVEKVGEEGKKAFQHVDELWDILNAPGNIMKLEKVTKTIDKKKRVAEMGKKKKNKNVE